MNKAKKTLIKGGELIQSNGPAGKLDVLIKDGVVIDIAADIACEDTLVLDATGLWVMPGFIDMHTHLREPGQEYKEDIVSGTLAALYGGYTAICCMPNTDPVNDNESVLALIRQKAEKAGHCRVYPVAAITKGLKGEELSEMGLLLRSGAVAFSDDGQPVESANRMRLALQYARNFDALLMAHSEDKSLSGGGDMNEGVTSAKLGLKGIPAAAESVMVARDIALAEAYGARLHVCHVSTALSVRLIRDAKARGVRVTCETTPHYFSADETWVEQSGYDANTKMNPPLRSKEDVIAITEGLRDGTIDAIATDHAPHHIDEKRVEFSIAANGIVGLETAFSLGVTHLVRTGKISPAEFVQCMSGAPAKILNVLGGVVEMGAAADITIADPSASVTYTAGMLHSKSKNTPFLNIPLYGKIIYTIVGGQQKI